jgi:hypothetical protein
LTKKESNVLDSVIGGKLVLEDDNLQLKMLVEKLYGQVEMLQEQNGEYLNRINELERQKNSMKQSVISFKEELGKVNLHPPSVSSRNHRCFSLFFFLIFFFLIYFGISRSQSPITTPQLEFLLDFEARSVLKSPSPPPSALNRSPSPDIHEYIRNLERKVEMQQRKLDEYQKYIRDSAKNSN